MQKPDSQADARSRLTSTVSTLNRAPQAQPSIQKSAGSESQSSGSSAKGDEPDFFDPALDDEDAAFVAQQRGGRPTDAILSCPCCLNTCCLECQQHAEVPGQYRAMFVTNCRVDFDDAQLVPTEASKKRLRGADPDAGRGGGQEDTLWPVYCGVCSARLGMYDSEEVFHFTGVIATEA